MRRMVDGEALQSFLTVAGDLNFRRAAERLHVDQSALSRRIQRLEAQIGFDPFIRSTREVRMTEAGQAFHGDNRRTLVQLHKAVERARRVAEGKAGQQRIGYMCFAAIEAITRASTLPISRHREVRP